MFPDALLADAEQLVQQLAAQSKTMTLAESCTGGLLAGLITSVPGASNVFHQSVVTYSNEAKQSLLNVDTALLAKHGAVSAEVARAMAEGALQTAKADIALSITGIAGPGGGTEEKPVGLVYIGCSSPSSQSETFTEAKQYNFSGTRQEVRLQACEKAIQMAIASL